MLMKMQGHRIDQDAAEQKELQKKMVEMPTAGLRDKINGDRQQKVRMMEEENAGGG